MKVENNVINYPLGQVSQPPRAESHEANKMSRLMLESASDKSTSPVQKSTDIVSQSEAKVTVIKEWYEALKSSGNFSSTALSRSLDGAFTSPIKQKEALWYAFNQEKSVKGTDKGSPTLLVLLEQELLTTFSGRLIAEPPKDRQELKVMLAEDYSLGAQKEQALWHSWAELKDIPDQEPLLDMVREELSFVIQKNAMVKNILTSSHKLDLS
ncbi:YopR family T3SS polymerization control protein [Grimontia sp. NTOU-MAR1]|uniref:YopR family T3SS polymerization control protein n=1 Tax=Grimontia sp. NTOU-MAR1 TaxID=3111011 RepID=UPI002DBB8B19|nr:YopR family T3SS polymerization control protein [Grimontia sp. NTOU-MAR1]WRW00185.1 YopR family T3SS polymerization control protein [Grimontia sp. NTOU-MAR1]